MKKILHIIPNLNNGGAERSLYILAKNDHLNEHIIICLSDKGKYGDSLLKLKINVYFLKKDRTSLFSYKILDFFLNLVSLIKSIKPDIVQTWMYNMDIFGGLAARLAGVKNIIWGVRRSSYEPSIMSKSLLNRIKISAFLSYFVPTKIVFNSRSGLTNHGSLGYCKNKMLFISNGFDPLSLDFGPTKNILNKLLKNKKKNFILGHVGNFKPEKDHYTLLKSLEYLRKKNYLFKCILVGRHVDKKNLQLKLLIKKMNLKNHIILLGEKNCISNLYKSLDLFILSSITEGCNNTLIEAMSQGVPCVSTNVGESKYIIGKFGSTVPINKPRLLSNSIEKNLNRLNNNRLKFNPNDIRKRISDKYSISKNVKKYQKLYDVLI